MKCWLSVKFSGFIWIKETLLWKYLLSVSLHHLTTSRIRHNCQPTEHLGVSKFGFSKSAGMPRLSNATNRIIKKLLATIFIIGLYPSVDIISVTF